MVYVSNKNELLMTCWYIELLIYTTAWINLLRIMLSKKPIFKSLHTYYSIYINIIFLKWILEMEN